MIAFPFSALKHLFENKRRELTRLAPNERIELHDSRLMVDMAEDAWVLRVHRFVLDKRGLPIPASWRFATMKVYPPARTTSDAEFVDLFEDACAALIRRVRRRLPENWRLFGRTGSAKKTTRPRRVY